MTRKRYRSIGLGGTFDHFHAGHEKFIEASAELADRLIIGVTLPSLTLSKPFAHTIESFDQRKASVIRFCRQKHFDAKVVPLQDIFGPTLEKSEVQALSVTPETEKGAELINQTRQKLNLRPLPVYICDYFLAENGQPLHAEDIRAGRVNRRGQVYRTVLDHTGELSASQRSFFQSPQGKLRNQPAGRGTPTCVVGDYCLENFIHQKWPYDLGIYDKLQQRAKFIPPVLADLVPNYTVKNPAGSISPQLSQALNQALVNSSGPQHILVEGEEDLAAVALFVLLPLGAYVYYGQPGEGMVEVVITEDFKEQVFNVLKPS